MTLPQAFPFSLAPPKRAESAHPSPCFAYLSASTSSLVTTVPCSAVHCWDLSTFISTSSCRRQKVLVVPAALLRAHMNSKGRRKSWGSAQVRLFMTQMWSTTSPVLNVKTSLNPLSPCNSFCLSQHFLHCRWGTESWTLLAKLLLLFQIFSPMDNGMQKTLCGIRSSLGLEV